MNFLQSMNEKINSTNEAITANTEATKISAEATKANTAQISELDKKFEALEPLQLQASP